MKKYIIKRINFNKKTILRRRKKPPVKRGESIDYKNQALLRKFVSEQGKILSRRISRLTSKQQRTMAKFIKSARIIGFMPFINNES